MTRARSGSFYCPIPDESVLSIAQKAAISTAPTATSSSSATVSPVGGRLRRHARSQSMSTAFELAVQKQHQQQHHLTPSDTSAARNSVGAICHDKTTVQALAPTLSIPMCKRYPWSPIKPSPLRRVASTGSKPLPPSALWTTHTELLPLYDDTTTSQLPAVYRTNHVDVAVVSRQSYYRHTLRAAFLAGPMAEKARIYGLRVAWCIYGDIKEQLAKEIFVTGAHAGHSLSSPSRHRQTSSLSISTVDSDVLDHVEVVQPEPEEMIRSRPVSPARTAFEWAVQEPLMKEDDAFESPELEEDDEDEEDSLSEYSSFSDTSSDTESIEELEFDHEFGLDFGIHED